VINTVVTKYAGQKLGYLTPNYFDKILLDAPCSLEGTIRNTPQILTNWKEPTIKRLSKLQKGLINSAFKCLKPNGILVYSTCTFAPEENEAVINYLLKKNPNAICEPISIPNLKVRPAILKWGRSEFDKQVENCIRIYPQDNDTEGFFVAKIKKTYLTSESITTKARKYENTK
jgi:16S rRNA C967 or C1407 C5-methylase (RsmB/RsmF family)